MRHTRQEQLEALGRIIDTLNILRVKCPWDAKQTNESLRPNTIEEVYELVQALMDDDQKNIKKELGDVLLHILFYAKIGDEKDQFDIADVADALNDKLIFRHPHVFGETKVDGADQVIQNWEQLKLKEKDGNRSRLSEFRKKPQTSVSTGSTPTRCGIKSKKRLPKQARPSPADAKRT